MKVIASASNYELSEHDNIVLNSNNFKVDEFKSQTFEEYRVYFEKNSCYGSGGLIGSTVVKFFSDLGFAVTGIDNNMRQNFLVRS